MSAYHFVDSDHCRPPGSRQSHEYELLIRQEPDRAKVCTNKEKERRPIDPPPIIQLKIKDDREDPCHNYLQSPHLFVCVDLCSANEAKTTVSNGLAGTSVSSLYRLKDIDNSDGGFFVFGDLSVKVEGQFRLRFYLFEVQKGDVCFRQTTTSAVFTVYNAKTFPGMLDSTFLSRSFSDQGVRIRIRKEHRIKMKRPPQRAILSPDRPQYALPDQRPPMSHLPPQYQIPSGQGPPFDGRPHPDYHFAGTPVRAHPPRPLDYQPYPRNQYPPGYFDRPPYTEMMPPNYQGPPVAYGPVTGVHALPEYAPPPNYGRGQLTHSPIEWHGRREPPRPSPSTYGDYSDRHQTTYSETQGKHYPLEQRPYQSPYPPDSLRQPHYVSETRPSPSHEAGPPHPNYNQPLQSMRHEAEHLSQRAGYSQEGSTSPYDTSRTEGPARGQHAPSHQQYAHERRESRHSINALLSEEGKPPSPFQGSRPGSETSSMGRSTPGARTEFNNQDVLDDRASNVRLPPLRNGSRENNQPGPEQSQTKSNSNLWKLVSVATHE